MLKIAVMCGLTIICIFLPLLSIGLRGRTRLLLLAFFGAYVGLPFLANTKTTLFFEHYALLKGIDQVIVMRGDASHPPEKLPRLIQLALSGPARFILASRLRRGTTPAWRQLSHRLSTSIQNRILGMQLHDYHTSLRL